MSGVWAPAVGDRVALKPSEGWNQPYRDMSKEGRLATVAVVRDRAKWKWDNIKIVFDVKRKGAKPREMWLEARDLLTPPLPAGADDGIA